MEFAEDVYNRSPFRCSIPYSNLTSTSDEYKVIRERFVSGFNGSTKTEVLLIVFVTPISIYLHQFIISYLVSVSRRFNDFRKDSVSGSNGFFKHMINLFLDVQIT